MASSAGASGVSNWEFGTLQQQFEVGSVDIGGRPGSRSTVLIGSIFYKGHSIVRDEERGEFDRAEAEKLLHDQQAWSERTRLPCMLDVVAGTGQAMQRYLEFAAAATPMPLLIDGTTAEVRRAGIEFVTRAGLANRAVYNSIQPAMDESELAAISSAGIESAILLAYRPGKLAVEGRIAAIREMLPRVRQAGIHKLLIDACAVDMTSLRQVWLALREVKDEFGLPAGAGIHNAISLWRDSQITLDLNAYRSCTSAVAAATAAMGADFLLYGPIKDAAYVFPAVAMIDEALSGGA
jgi:N5-methyltetrahydromethanopterin:coenzyme M methyltransferase subunit H